MFQAKNKILFVFLFELIILMHSMMYLHVDYLMMSMAAVAFDAQAVEQHQLTNLRDSSTCSSCLWNVVEQQQEQLLVVAAAVVVVEVAFEDRIDAEQNHQQYDLFDIIHQIINTRINKRFDLP